MQNITKNHESNRLNMCDLNDQIDQKLLTLESYIEDRSRWRSE